MCQRLNKNINKINYLVEVLKSKMKKFSVIFVLLFPLVLFCQTSDSVKLKKINLGITFSPDYSFRTIKTEASNQWIKDSYDTLEVAKFGYTTGLNLVFKFNKNFSLAIGFLVSDKGEKTKKWLTPIPPAINYNSHYYYLDIPIKANYVLINKKMKLYVSAGISTNILESHKIVILDGINETKKTFINNTQLSKINFAMLAGFGIDCPITNKWYFKVEPIYRRSIGPIADAPLKKYLYSLGLNFGFYCQF